MAKDNLKDETANSTNNVLADSSPKFTLDDLRRAFEAARESKYVEATFRKELGWENDCEDKYAEFEDWISEKGIADMNTKFQLKRLNSKRAERKKLNNFG